MSGSSLHGDFGVSLATQQKVLTEFLTLFPATLELSFFAMLFAIADRRARRRDRGGQARRLLRPGADDGLAVRLFDADLLVGPAAHHVRFGARSGLTAGLGPHRPHQLLFRPADRLHDRSTRCCPDQPGAVLDALRHLILPAIVLGTVPLGVIARMTRSSMLEVLSEDYVRTARAKGLVAVPRHRRARAAQRAAAGRDRDRPLGLGPDGRRGADRDDLLLAGRRPLADRFDRPARLSGAAGRRDAGLRPSSSSST